MTAPQHAASRHWHTEVLDWLCNGIASTASALSGWARYLRARVAMRLGRLDDAEMAAAKLAFDGDADGPGGPLEHLPSCDGTCGGAVAHAAHLDDGWCPCCYCAQFAVDGPQDAATTSPPVEAAGLPGDGAPVRPGQPLQAPPLPGPPHPGSPGQGRRDTWVHTQDPPGTPRPVLAVRRDGLIGIDGHGHITVEPASNMHMQDLASSLSVTASQPVYAERTPTMPNPALAEPDPYRLNDIVRPWLAFTGDERDRVRWCAEWIRDRDAALAARGGTR